MKPLLQSHDQYKGGQRAFDTIDAMPKRQRDVLLSLLYYEIHIRPRHIAWLEWMDSGLYASLSEEWNSLFGYDIRIQKRNVLSDEYFRGLPRLVSAGPRKDKEILVIPIRCEVHVDLDSGDDALFLSP